MNLYVFAAYCAALVFIVGLALIFVLDAAAKKRNRSQNGKFFKFIEYKFIPDLRNAMINALEEEMEMIPEKLKEIKREMEDENGI